MHNEQNSFKRLKQDQRALIRWLDEREIEPSEITDIFSISPSTLGRIRHNDYNDNLSEDKALRAGVKEENSMYIVETQAH